MIINHGLISSIDMAFLIGAI